MSSKKRVLIIADYYIRSTGYARVASSIMLHLKDKYDIGHLGVSDIPINPDIKHPIDYYTVLKNHGKCCGKGDIIEHRPKDSNVTQYLVPTLSVPHHKDQNFCNRAPNIESDLYGQDSCFFVIQHFKPDIVIPINDIWGLYHYNYLLNRNNYIFAPYLAIDSECFPAKINPQKPNMPIIDTLKFVSGTNKVIVFTEFAKNTLNETVKLITGDKEANNIAIIPHGVDRNLFKPLDNKSELREKYFHLSPDKDIFLLGVVSRNQVRKSFDLLMMSLKIFIDRYEKPNKKLLCHFHCAMEDRMGWDLVHLAKYYGVLDRCIFDNKLMPGMGVPEPILNEIMNSYNAHILLSTAEGWGLSILETMSAGIPNIVSNFSAHGDWTEDAVLKVKIAAKFHEVRTNHRRAIADVNHAAKQINLLYNSPKLCREYSKKSIQLADKLQWKNVCDKWIELIDSFDISKFTEDRYNSEIINNKLIPEFPKNPINTEFELLEI